MSSSAATSTSLPRPLAFIGLGAMGSAMSLSLIRASFPLIAFDISSATLYSFLKSAAEFPDGESLAQVAPSPAAACKSVSVALFMVANQSHVESALLAPETGALYSLPKGAAIVITATVSPSYVIDLRRRLDDTSELNRPDLLLIDAPVSGGTARSATGTLTIMASSPNPSDLARADVRAALNALSDSGKNLYLIPGGLGSGLKLKALNQVNCGVNITAASEVMGVAAVLGLNTQSFYDGVVSDPGAEGWSWMLGDRGTRMLSATPKISSATGIIVKDVGIILDEAKKIDCVLPLVARSKGVLDNVVKKGMVSDDDSCVVKVYLGDERRDLVVESATKTDKDQEMEGMVRTAHACVHLMGAYETVFFAQALGLDGPEQVERWITIIGGAAGGSPVFTRAMEWVFGSNRESGSVEQRFKDFVRSESGFDGAKKYRELDGVIRKAEVERYDPILMKEAAGWMGKLLGSS